MANKDEKELKQLEAMLQDVRTVKEIYSTIKERMYPPKQEKRELPKDVPTRKQLNATSRKIDRVEKSISRIYRSKKKRIRPVEMTSKAKSFLKLDEPYYDSTLLLRVIHLYTLYNDLSDGETFRTDKKLEKILGKGPHTVISVNNLISKLYKKKAKSTPKTDDQDEDDGKKNDEDDEMNKVKEFLEEEVDAIDKLTVLKDKYRTLSGKLAQLIKKRDEEDEENELLDKRIKTMKKEVKNALAEFKEEASKFRVFADE